MANVIPTTPVNVFPWASTAFPEYFTSLGTTLPVLLCAISDKVPLMIKTKTVPQMDARFMEFSF
jgi:hypothetical protein